MKKIIISFILLSTIYACQDDSKIPPAQQSVLPSNDSKSPTPTSSSITQSSETPKINPSPSVTPPALLAGEKDDEDKDVQNKIDKDPVSTDAQAVKTNINWKVYNPIIKGKKYTYSFTLKEGTLELKNLSLSSESKIALQSFANSKNNLFEVIKNSSSGKELIEKGFEEDLKIACQINSSNAIPFLNEDGFYYNLNK